MAISRRQVQRHGERPVLYGRGRECANLQERLAAAISGHGSLVLISGEAGIGKTSLVEALVDSAARSNSLVLVGHSYDLTNTPPYGPWIELAEEYQRRGRASTPLPASIRDDTARSELGGSTAFFFEVREFLEAVAANRPLLIVLEDLHWADGASLDLLRYLGRYVADLPILIVVTYRDDEVTRRHPLYQLLPLLIRESRPRRIEVRRLDRQATGDLLRASYELGAADQERLTDYLHEHAQGNPFYLGEMLRSVEEQRLLSQSHDQWQLADLSAMYVPPLIHQFIDQRLGKLGTETRELLEIAAVIGQVVPFDLWRTVSTASDLDLESNVDRAIDARILAEPKVDAGLQFTHALIREALYQGLTFPRRRAIHLRVAETLSASSGVDPDTAAHHFQQAGDPRSADWLIMAGERAQRAYAWQVASERFQSALAVLERQDGPAGQRGWLLYRVGRMLRFIDLPRSVRYLEDARRLGLSAGYPILAAFALIDSALPRHLLGQIRRSLDDVETGIAELRSVTDADEGVSETDILTWVADALPSASDGPTPSHTEEPDRPVWSLMREGLLVVYLANSGRFHEALKLGETYSHDPQRHPEIVDTRADLQFGLGIAHASLGMPGNARAAFQRAQDICRTTHHHVILSLALAAELSEVILVFETDQVEKRWPILTESEAAADDGIEARHLGLSVSFRRVPVLMIEGRWAEARQIAESPGTRVYPGFRIGTDGSLAAILRAQGEGHRAWNIIFESLPEGPDTEPGDVYYSICAAPLQRLAVRLSIDNGDLDQARSWLGAYDRWMEWTGTVVGRADGQMLWAEYHRARGDLGIAVEHAEQALTLANAPRQPLVLVAAHRLMGELSSDLRQANAAEHHLDTALALADACAAPYERALTLIAIAEKTGDVADAAKALDEAEAICAQINASPALSRIATMRTAISGRQMRIPYPAGLTAREVDVLRLVAEGLTDAEVADRLYVSRRTVTSHLTSIYTKLDVSSRAAATRFAVEQGLTS